MIRVVLEHSPSLYVLCGLIDEAELGPTMTVNDNETYYRSVIKSHYQLYKRALSGWGAAGNPDDPRPVFAPGQR
jgi:hypothetical protein